MPSKARIILELSLLLFYQYFSCMTSGIAFQIPCNVVFVSCVLPVIIYTDFNLEYGPFASFFVEKSGVATV